MPVAENMLANRLRKNLARLGPAFRREQTDAFRLYDRDIPEIPWTVDRYGDRALVSEFVTPVARRRSDEERDAERDAVVAAVADVLEIKADRVHVKTRERHVAKAREAEGTPANEFTVREDGFTFLVNLTDYLDTGLFLDHRVARRRVRAASSGRRVLNLFCYTGAFSVHAAKGGAASTVSVDLSATYLAWAERNFAANGLDRKRHVTVRADVAEYLRTSRDRFDVVVLDPPTMSRSSRGKSFDLQDAHGELITRARALLAPGGVLVFSTNYRRFRLDDTLAGGTEITAQTTPPDFRDGLHRAWEFRAS